MFRGSLGGLHGPFGLRNEWNNTPEIPLPGIEPSLFSQWLLTLLTELRWLSLLIEPGTSPYLV